MNCSEVRTYEWSIINLKRLISISNVDRNFSLFRDNSNQWIKHHNPQIKCAHIGYRDQAFKINDNPHKSSDLCYIT